MCSPLLSQLIDGQTGEWVQCVPEAVVIIRCQLIVMSDAIFQSIERDEWLWLRDLVFVAEVWGFPTLLHTAIELTRMHHFLCGHFTHGVVMSYLPKGEWMVSCEKKGV